jgi:hypothetical protein
MSRFEAAVKGKNLSVAKDYSSTSTYIRGDLIRHPTFGVGVTTAIKDGSKVEILFESGSKVLVHGR